MNRKQRGSALLVTLMVVVGLSLLGLGFVAISETESSISINERNYSQALAVAEAGAKTAVEWFQSPPWAVANALLPANDETLYPTMKRTRTVVVNTGGTPFTYTGKYKPTSTTPVPLLFDKPYKSKPEDRLYGDEARADVIINDTTTSVAFMNTLNLRLFNDKRNGEVTEIRVFAPPILGGSVNAGGFWEGGTRYGVASIKVTAQKRADDGSGRVIAERSVKVVVTEWPFPGPQGPVQSNANIGSGGSWGVHWGRMTSQLNMAIAKEENSLPWHDPWNLVKFEHGFETRTAYEWRPGFPVSPGMILHPSQTAIFATPALSRFGYTAGALGTTGTAEPAWSTTTAATPPDNGISYARRPSQQYPNRVTTFNDGDDSYNWLYEMANKNIEDPWFNARARVDMTSPSGVGTAPFIINDYNDPTVSEGCAGACGVGEPRFNLFQGQDQNSPKPLKEVTFPRIDYSFWKSIAQQADSAGTGAKYLRWDRVLMGDRFLDRNNVSRQFWQWVNTAAPTNAPAGFYFFDTRNGLDPQFPGGAAFLTPAITLNSSDANPFQMQGFIYLNTATLNFNGMQGVDRDINVPGEPYRDIGYRKVDPATGGWATDTATGDYIIEGANNGKWDYQTDLGGTTTGFDVVLESRAFVSADGGAATAKTYRFPKTYDPAICTIAALGNSVLPAGCTEPSEPWLNIRYAANSNLPQGDPTFVMGWGTPTSAHVPRPNKKNATGGVPANCADLSLCTSTGYDKNGAFQTIELNLVGILYVEGAYGANGQPRFFGSLLINGNFLQGGNMEVYFDECLVKDCWEENFRNFPRVYISTHETDQ